MMNNLGGLSNQQKQMGMNSGNSGMQTNTGQSQGGLGGLYAGNSDPFAELDKPNTGFGVSS